MKMEIRLEIEVKQSGTSGKNTPDIKEILVTIADDNQSHNKKKRENSSLHEEARAQSLFPGG